MLVFTKKKYVKAEGKKVYRENKSWINRCNGQEVVQGHLGLQTKNNMYLCARKWCKEV